VAKVLPRLLDLGVFGVPIVQEIATIALQMDEKKHVLGHPPAQRQHLRREEVSPSSAKWVRMKAGHVVIRSRSGAGGSAWRCRILPTV